MLVNFTVSNFLSFKESSTLNLVPDALKELEENLHIPYLYNSEERLLKSIAIYGHNSHGKSNFLKAFQFLHSFVFSSFALGQTQNKIDIESFRLNTSMAQKPSLFEIVFLIKETKYRYRIQLTADKILEESLYYAESKVRENYLFERIEQDFKFSKNWNREADNRLDAITAFAKPHILFLSVLISQENIPRISDISKWLNSNLIIPDDYQKEYKKAYAVYSDLNYRPLILKFISRADLGFITIFDKIDNIQQSNLQLDKGLLNMWFDSEIKNFNLYTKHDVFDESYKKIDSIELELQKSESAGSIKYFIIACLLAYAIKNSQLIWVDELDSRFHSSLLEMLVKSYHDPKINPQGSQLVFTVHNTVLMDKKLRRDQMVVIEKNDYGESSLRRLHSSKKPLRINKSIEKEYREGELGGTSKKIADRNKMPKLGFED